MSGRKITINFIIATLQYTELSGAVQNALLTWKGHDADLEDNGSVRFAVYENAQERARGVKKALFVMPITPEDVLALISAKGNVGTAISDASWEIAKTRKFISSRVITTADGVEKVTMELHSLDDLGAKIIDVG